MTGAATARSGKVRVARLTDLAALAELSRLCQTGDDSTRSLGLPVAGPPIGVFSLFRLPLGAFRPHDLLFVFEEGGHIAGLLRVERETPRDDWTIVELDGIGVGEAGDIRFRLVQHVLRDGVRRGAARFHVACADRDGNVELFMQAGFARFGEETILVREPTAALPEPWSDAKAAEHGIRPVLPMDAVALSRLYATVTPQPVARLEAVRLPDWERQGMDWRVPKSSLAPILRFADIEGFIVESAEGDQGNIDGFLQLGIAKEDQPHYMKIMMRPETDAGPLVEFGLGVIHARAGRGGISERGVFAPVRTYESPIDRRLEDHGFAAVASMTLLMKETMVRVAQPALVPAIR
jgi:hypothetical protein